MKKMLWGGRFSASPSEAMIDFNSAENIGLDQRLVPYDILGSLAHISMLKEQGILSEEEHVQIASALKRLHSDWRQGAFKLRKELEDVHMNVEHAVTEMTPAGKKMHTARSRNDQVLLDMRLYMREGTLQELSALSSLRGALQKLSLKDGPMVSYTHTRIAQPITVSFWCEAWYDSFARDMERLKDLYTRVNRCPLGAGAIAGTSWKIDRKIVAKMLAFENVQENELDTISSRGECEAELLSALSIVMCKLSRLSEELIWLSEKSLISIAEEHTTGSSMMPNKKNPDVLELIRGRAGRLYGHLTHCLVSLKGLMGGYNSDMQETKYAVMGGLDSAISSIDAATMVLSGLAFDHGRIALELERGFAQATEIADHLARHGIPFREAHHRMGALVKKCEAEGKTISGLGAEEASAELGLQISEGRWGALKCHDRTRLKRKLSLVKDGFAQKETEKISKAYEELLA
ncbi:MAG: argininosuccinate lyase [Candidatus Micrarchaeota archaeon]